MQTISWLGGATLPTSEPLSLPQQDWKGTALAPFPDSKVESICNKHYRTIAL